MIRKEKNGIHWLEFEIFADYPQLQHGIFLRHGGFSSGKFATLNLSNAVGDEPKAVEANQKKVLELLGNPRLLWAHQVHSDGVIQVTDEEQKLSQADALTTSKKDIALMIHHADCQAALFFDPVEKAFAVVHSGWRGSVKNIYQKTIQSMCKKYGTKPQNLLVGISPSLGPNHAEFINYKEELPPHFWDYQVRPYYFDFWSISRAQLVKEGIPNDNIEIAQICTYANEADFYSYRRQKIRGGHGTIALLRSRP